MILPFSDLGLFRQSIILSCLACGSVILIRGVSYTYQLQFF